MILSLDASAAQGSVALLDRGQVARELFPDTPRGRGGALFSALEELLHDAPTIRRVVVGVGPGSYNGIRSAIAAAWGIATARKIPLVGISSVLGLADGEYFAVGDARRQQYFLAQVRRGTFISEPDLLAREQVEAELHKAAHLPIFASAPIEFLSGRDSPHAQRRQARSVGCRLAAKRATAPLPEGSTTSPRPSVATNDSDVEDQRSSERGRCYFPTAASSAGGVSALESDAKPRYFLPLFLTIPRETRF